MAITLPMHAGSSSAALTPALIVLGIDEAGKSHASWFDADELELAAKAAGLMGMVALPVASKELRDAAGRLPHGRVFSSGKAFVPFVKAATFHALAAHLPKGTKITRMAARPKRPELVGNGSDHCASKLSASDGAAIGAADEPVRFTMPCDWSAIVAGSLVLMSEGEGHGWYEAVVVEAHDDELFTLRWRDWPELATLVRHRRHLGILHPDHAAE